MKVHTLGSNAAGSGTYAAPWKKEWMMGWAVSDVEFNYNKFSVNEFSNVKDRFMYE